MRSNPSTVTVLWLQLCGMLRHDRHDTLVKVQYHNDFNEAQKEAPGLAQGSVKAIADACGRQWVDIF